MDFNTLLKRISPRLKHLARRLLKTQSGYGSIDAGDVYQEMCLHLWQRFKNGVPPEFNDAYVIKSCEFHIRNFLRKEKDKFNPRSLEEPINDTGLLLKDTIQGDQSNHQACFNNILIEEIRNKMITKKEGDVFNLLMQGHTVRSIGQCLGISHVMVVKYKNRIIERWKNSIADSGYQKERNLTYSN